MSDLTLDYIQTILDEGSISQAAKRLFIAQPSLSQYIKRIEKEFGAEILDRNSKTIKLTAAGEVYLETELQIRQLRRKRVDQINDLLELNQGRLTIGSSHYRSTYLLTRVLPIFKERYPNIQIQLEEGITESLEEYADNGVTDFSIVLLPLRYKELVYEELFQEKIVLALPANHPICSNANAMQKKDSDLYPAIDFNLLKDESFIVMKKGQKLRNSFFDLCQLAGFQPNIILQTNSMITAQALTSVGIGTTILPDVLAEDERFSKTIRYFSSLQFIAPRRVVAVYSKHKPLSKAATKFLEILKESL